MAKRATRKQLAWRRKVAAMVRAGKFRMPRRVTKAPRSKRLKVNPITLKNYGTMTRGQLNGLLKTFPTGTLISRGELMITASFKGEKLLSAARIAPGLFHVRAPLGMIERKENPRGRRKNPVGTFNRSQLDRLAHHYGKIKTINPSGPGYRKRRSYLAEFPQAALKQLAGERIKFLSSMARNRVAR